MRKNIFKTIMLSVLIVTVLASGMTSFAATVSTTTTYNPATANVHVSTTVSGVEVGSMVAYMVTKDTAGTITSSDVLYANQKTASTGVLNFEYEIDKTKLPNTSDTTLGTKVKFGSNEKNPSFNNANDSTGNDYAHELGLANITETKDGGVDSISYFTDRECQHSAVATTGYNESVYARVSLKYGYELATVTVDDEEAEIDGNVFEVKRSINVVTTDSAAPAGIAATKKITATYDVDGENPITGYGYMIEKRGGDLQEVGIEYGGYLYPAILENGNNDTLTAGVDDRSDRVNSNICVVVLIFGGDSNYDDGNLDSNLSAEDAFAAMTPYYKANGTYYSENDEILGYIAPLYASMSVPVPELTEGLKIPKKPNLVIDVVDNPSDDNDEEVSENSDEPVVEDSETPSEVVVDEIENELEENFENNSDNVEDNSDIIENNVNE